MLAVKLDQKPQAIKDLDLTPVSTETVDEVLNQEPGYIQEIPLPTFKERLTVIITQLEGGPKTDNIVKVLGKLKGALELLS